MMQRWNTIILSQLNASKLFEETTEKGTQIEQSNEKSDGFHSANFEYSQHNYVSLRVQEETTSINNYIN